MSQGNCNNESRKGKHLTLREQYVIETLAKEKMEPKAIAARQGRNRRTIEQELLIGRTKLKNSDWSDDKNTVQRSHSKGVVREVPVKDQVGKIGYDHALAKLSKRRSSATNIHQMS